MTTQAIGTTTAAAATNTINNGLAQVADNYQTFLSLLTTQLQNQDPLSPLDTNQFTQQLTQMTGVEQQLLSNQLLQQLVNQNQGGMIGAVDLIGKSVTASSSTEPLANGTATWQFSLPTAPANMSASVLDSNGNTVWSGLLSPNGAGAQTFTWNGQNASGVQQPDGGVYTLQVTATDSSGNPITATSSVQGVVTAVQQVNGQTMVTVGSAQIPLSSITGVNGSAG